MSKRYDSLKQVRLDPKTDKALEQLRRLMPVKSGRGSLANACLILGIAAMKQQITAK